MNRLAVACFSFIIAVMAGANAAYAATATIRITVSPRENDWASAPVRVAFDSILRAPSARTWSHPVTSAMITVRESGRGGAVVPHRPAWTLQGEDEGAIIFSKTGAGRKTYDITISTEAPADPNRRIPLVGYGEPMSYGRPGIVTGIDGSFSNHHSNADWDGDGDADLFVAQGMGGGATWTMHGVHYYENIGGPQEPLMARPTWLIPNDGTPYIVDWNGDGLLDIVSQRELYVNKGPRGALNFERDTTSLKDTPPISCITDWDGDGLFDIMYAASIGGGDPSPSTWLKDVPGSPYTSEGVWRGYDGHGRLLVYRNVGAAGHPAFVAVPETLRAAGEVLDVVTGGYPNVGDIDGDGDLDVLVGNRFDLYYFENTGTRTEPVLARGYPLDLHLEDIYIRSSVADLTGDGRQDILFSEENGDVRWVENLGKDEQGRQIFGTVQVIQQQDPFIDIGSGAEFDLKDLNDDGRPDILGGNSYGEIWLWLSVADAPPWTFQVGKRVSAGDRLIRIYAGPAGSIQGPGEARYGYVAPEITDWDEDGELDFIMTDVWGKNRFYRALSHSADGPVYAAEELIRFADPADVIKPMWNWWDPEGGELVTQWRIRPEALDWDGDGVTDYVGLDHEGVLTLFPGAMTGEGKRLKAPRRVFLDEGGNPLVLNIGVNGHSGRHKINFADWDKDGDLDLFCSFAEPTGNRLVDPDFERGCVRYFENLDGQRFAHRGELVPDPEIRLAGHSSCPQAYDFDGDGTLDMLAGAEDGHIYAFHRAYLERDLPRVQIGRVQIRR